MDSRFEWFSTWVDQHLLLTFTAVAVPDPDHVRVALGPARVGETEQAVLDAEDAQRLDQRVAQ